MIEPRKILIVRKDNIGDLVCTTPLIAAVRERYPLAKIGALVNSYNAPVLAGNKNVDDVYVYEKAKHRAVGEPWYSVYIHRMRLMFQIRRERYDLCILANCSFSPSSLRLARQMGAKNILGFVEGKFPEKEKYVLYKVPYSPGGNGHEVERLARLLSPLGAMEHPIGPVQVFPDSVLVARQRNRLAAAWDKVGPSLPVAIHISARKPSQRWPASRFISLMRSLYEKGGKRFMLFWSPGDEYNPLHPGDDGKAREILSGLSDVPVLPCPTQRLEELIAGLACCGSMICSDGGAMHLGAGLGLPIVCFFGESDANKWHPWGVPYQLIQPESKEVGDISVDQVLAAYSLLESSSRNDLTTLS